MKPIKSLLVFAVVAICSIPALASAQGYYYGPGNGGRSGTVQGGFHNRMGRLTFGFGLGLGGMGDNGSSITSCDNCDYQPLAVEADIHIGGMLTPRFGLMFEGQVNAQTIHSSFYDDDTTLSQSAAMIAGQFWILPVLWIKGGLGFSHLQVDDTYVVNDLGNGLAIMGAVGVELMSARNFAFELQGRLIEGTYNGGDDHVTSGTVGIGINWY